MRHTLTFRELHLVSIQHVPLQDRMIYARGKNARRNALSKNARSKIYSINQVTALTQPHYCVDAAYEQSRETA